MCQCQQWELGVARQGTWHARPPVQERWALHAACMHTVTTRSPIELTENPDSSKLLTQPQVARHWTVHPDRKADLLLLRCRLVGAGVGLPAHPAHGGRGRRKRGFRCTHMAGTSSFACACRAWTACRTGASNSHAHTSRPLTRCMTQSRCRGTWQRSAGQGRQGLPVLTPQRRGPQVTVASDGVPWAT